MGYRVGLLLHVALARERDVREGDRAQKDVSSTSLEVGAQSPAPSQPSLQMVHTSEWFSLWVPTGSPQGVWRLGHFS